MRTPRALGAALLATALASCSGRSRTGVWVYDSKATVDFSPPESHKWMADKVAAMPMEIRLELWSDNTFTEAITGGPAAGSASGSFKSTFDGILLDPTPGANGPLPAGEVKLKQLDRNHLQQQLKGLAAVLVPEGYRPEPSAPPASDAPK